MIKIISKYELLIIKMNIMCPINNVECENKLNNYNKNRKIK